MGRHADPSGLQVVSQTIFRKVPAQLPQAPRWSRFRFESAIARRGGGGLRLVSNQKQLASKIVTALWEEFQGQRTSGMWWTGQIGQIEQVAEERGLAKLNKPDDLRPLLKMLAIQIGRLIQGRAQRVAEIRFNSAFEESHGVGILTDGREILGSGYMGEAAIYEPQARRGSGRSR